MTQDLMKLVDAYAGYNYGSAVGKEARAAVVAALEALTKESRHHLSNLLARIHRDGGHYEAEHGTEKAAQDADLLVAHINMEYDVLRGQVAALTKDAEKSYQAGHNAGVAHHKKATEHRAKDAARYRAIRNSTTIYTVDREYDTGIEPVNQAVLFEELDNAIYAATAAQKEQV